MVTSLLTGTLASMSNTNRTLVASEYPISPNTSSMENKSNAFCCNPTRSKTNMSQHWCELNSRRYGSHSCFLLNAPIFAHVCLPELPGMPLRIPARLGKERRLLSCCCFSRDRYLFRMWLGTTRFSKSLFWILGSSFSPSVRSMASSRSPWHEPYARDSMAQAYRGHMRKCAISESVEGE
ncbi:hypothetical protein DPEC_G00316430 [Dallia pectoralis]|uniref:Uncharacterized protein n=1 Tax=Dallia pectoralis TaxID=75939 RepID=A0ACC2FCR2_DALPE|nr:hypothetical protein DPEC_G00316430 [Dallia pectoralis]